MLVSKSSLLNLKLKKNIIINLKEYGKQPTLYPKANNYLS